MKILIAGASGFVGSDLIPFLRTEGHSIKTLVRNKRSLSDDEIGWDPAKGHIHSHELEGFDAIINLAGENISSGRWNEKRKKAILESRINASRTLVNAILPLKNPPHLFINASAIGYYGNRGSQLLTEESTNGTGFLAHVCEEWESAVATIQTKNIRLVYLRFGIILSPKGGVLGKMLIPFKLGLGGVIGKGNQYMSWIALVEVLNIIQYVLKNDGLSGPINVVSPNPVTNDVFTKTLGKVLSRPTIFNIPAKIVSFIFGEMGDELLLASQKVVPEKLIKSGYKYIQPDLENVLKQMLTK